MPAEPIPKRKRQRKPKITQVNGFKIGSIVAISAKDSFHNTKLAVVTDACKWDEDGIVCTLTDPDFPYRNVVIFPSRGDTIKLVTK